MLYAEWPAAAGQPVLELRSRVQTRDHAVDFAARPATVEELSPQARKLYTSPTEHMPLDGIVHDTMRAAIKGARTDVDKARAIYEWVVDEHLPRSQGARLRPGRREDACSGAARSAASAPT